MLFLVNIFTLSGMSVISIFFCRSCPLFSKLLFRLSSYFIVINKHKHKIFIFSPLSLHNSIHPSLWYRPFRIFGFNLYKYDKIAYIASNIKFFWLSWNLWLYELRCYSRKPHNIKITYKKFSKIQERTLSDQHLYCDLQFIHNATFMIILSINYLNFTPSITQFTY